MCIEVSDNLLALKCLIIRVFRILWSEARKYVSNNSQKEFIQQSYASRGCTYGQINFVAFIHNCKHKYHVTCCAGTSLPLRLHEPCEIVWTEYRFLFLKNNLPLEAWRRYTSFFGVILSWVPSHYETCRLPEMSANIWNTINCTHTHRLGQSPTLNLKYQLP